MSVWACAACVVFSEARVPDQSQMTWLAVWDLNSDRLKEEYVLVSTEQSLQPLIHVKSLYLPQLSIFLLWSTYRVTRLDDYFSWTLPSSVGKARAHVLVFFLFVSFSLLLGTGTDAGPLRCQKSTPSSEPCPLNSSFWDRVSLSCLSWAWTPSVA